MVKNQLQSMEKKLTNTLGLIVMLLWVSCKSDSVKTKNDTIEADTAHQITFKTDFKSNLTFTAMKYVDSLNNVKGQVLPVFLYDANFDYRDSFLLTGGAWHAELYSLRIEIFKKVDRKDVLSQIVNDNYFRTQFDKKNIRRNSGRFDMISNYDLAKLRLLEINSKIDTLSKLQ